MITTKLRDYQQSAADLTITQFKTNQEVGKGIFFDPGLGKTLTTLYIIDQLYFRYKRLGMVHITVPNLIIPGWVKEIRESTDWFENPRVEILRWSNKNTKKYNAEIVKFFETNNNLKIFIANKESISSQNKKLGNILTRIQKYNDKVNPVLWVVDECTSIGRHKSRITERLLRRRYFVEYAIGLTGTDIATSIEKLHSMLKFIDPKIWRTNGIPDSATFKDKFTVRRTITVNNTGKLKTYVIGYKNLAKLNKIANKVVIRAKKEIVMPQLPEKIDSYIPIELSKKQYELYNKIENDLFAVWDNKEISVGYKLHLNLRLKQISGGFIPDTKFSEIGKSSMVDGYFPKMEYIYLKTRDLNEKYIIWCVFVNEILYMEEFLNNKYKKVVCKTYYGGNNENENLKNEQDFEHNEAIKYLIVNPMAGSYGKNWPFATYQFFYEPFDKAEQYSQAKDRSHRLTTIDTCFYEHLYGENTIEYLLYKKLEQKISIMNLFHNSRITDIVYLLQRGK